MKTYLIENFKSEQAKKDFFTSKRMNGGLFTWLMVSVSSFEWGNEKLNYLQYAIKGKLFYGELPPLTKDFSKRKPKFKEIKNE